MRDRAEALALSTSTWRSILDSISTRLDENRDILRYLAGLLVFLGLLGTFWGLVTTVSAVGATIQSLSVGSGDAGIIFEDLKAGLAAPLSGMGIAFSSSLFGLSGSLVLGFLDLQAGQAQNRFYTELEDWLSTITDPEELGLADEEIGNSPLEIRASVERLARIVQDGGGAGAPRPPPWRTSRRASRAWSSTCARSSRWCATGWRRSPCRARRCRTR